MLKWIIPIIIVIAVLLAPAASASVMAQRVTQSLSFSGTTAKCYASIRETGAEIEATMELSCNGTIIATWSGEGETRLVLNNSTTVIVGQTYTLTVSGTINGVPFTPLSTSKTC